MTRLNLLLTLALILTALSLVTSSHRARKLFIGLEESQAQHARIEEDWRRLQLEQGTLAKHAFVEEVAKKRLGMRTPDARALQFVPLGIAAGVKP